MEMQTKLQLKEALKNVHGTYNRKELYRILTISEDLGFEWNSREMYGGGYNVKIYDNHDLVSEIILKKDWHSGKDTIDVRFEDDYFTSDFRPLRKVYYSGEYLAEIKNEQALYGYEMEEFYYTRD